MVKARGGPFSASCACTAVLLTRIRGISACQHCICDTYASALAQTAHFKTCLYLPWFRAFRVSGCVGRAIELCCEASRETYYAHFKTVTNSARAMGSLAAQLRPKSIRARGRQRPQPLSPPPGRIKNLLTGCTARWGKISVHHHSVALRTGPFSSPMVSAAPARRPPSAPTPPRIQKGRNHRSPQLIKWAAVLLNG